MITFMALLPLGIVTVLPALALMGLVILAFPVTGTPVLKRIRWEFLGLWLALLMAMWVLPDSVDASTDIVPHPFNDAVRAFTKTSAEETGYISSLFFVAVAIILWIMMIVKGLKSLR